MSSETLRPSVRLFQSSYPPTRHFNHLKCAGDFQPLVPEKISAGESAEEASFRQARVRWREAHQHAVKPVTQGKVRKWVSVKESLKDNKTSPWSFSSFHSRATQINTFYANLFFCYFFNIFIHLHSLFCVLPIRLVEFSVTGCWFLIFLLCLFSRSQMRCDEVTKSAKSGTKKLSLALQMEHVFSGLFFILHWAAKVAQPELSVHENKDGGVLVGYFVKLLYTFNCLINNHCNAVSLEAWEAANKRAINSRSNHRDFCRLLT